MEDWPEWQQPYVYGTFVIWPPYPVRVKVNRLRHRYDPVSQAICEAHVTLTQPFHSLPTPDHWKRLRDVLRNCEPFEIQYGPVNSFLPYPCLWFEIHPAEYVLWLRQALHDTGLFNLDLPHPDFFVPHMTITEGQSQVKVTEALFAKLRARLKGGSFWCSEIAYIVPRSGFQFELERKLPLGR